MKNGKLAWRPQGSPIASEAPLAPETPGDRRLLAWIGDRASGGATAFQATEAGRDLARDPSAIGAAVRRMIRDGWLRNTATGGRTNYRGIHCVEMTARGLAALKVIAR